MSGGDAYATVAEYRSRVGKTGTDDDTDLAFQLKAVSRFIDRRTRRQDGFNRSAVEARIFDGNGKAKLWVDDIATTTGLIVKYDANADYDYADAGETLTINTHFWPGPYNAANGSEPKPYEWLELVPTNSVVTTWPLQRRALEVTAAFGWPEVPLAIKDLTVALTRYLRDIQESGMTFAIQAIESSIAESRQMSFFLKEIERQYARPQSF